MKKAVYTANIGDYDRLAPFQKQEGWDYIMFTDNEEVKSDGLWEVRHIKPIHTNILTARHIKLCPHIYMSEFDVTIWVDSNITPNCGLDDLLEKYFTEPLAVRNHLHNCIYKEADLCLKLGRGNIEEIRTQMRAYMDAGYPAENGCAETGILIRDNSKRVREFCEAWWEEVEKYSNRDQLSFPVVLSWFNLPVSWMPWEVLTKDFNIHQHI